MDSWSGAANYEAYVGRWSRVVAPEFVAWLAVPAQARWLDIGCGTGALTETVLERAQPSEVVGVDPTADFVDYAAAHVADGRASFLVGTAAPLPVDDASFDAVVSALVLNFIPDRIAGLIEMHRATRRGGVVAAYVWDYPGEMQLMKRFWDTAAQLDPAARSVHEGVRFEFCQPGPLRAMFVEAGFENIDVAPIVVQTVFADFDDYWAPFVGGGNAPAPSYARSLSEADRSALREALRAGLPTDDDGSIRLTARAWAVRGTVRR